MSKVTGTWYRDKARELREVIEWSKNQYHYEIKVISEGAPFGIICMSNHKWYELEKYPTGYKVFRCSKCQRYEADIIHPNKLVA